MKEAAFLRYSRYNRVKKKDNPEGRLTMAIIHYLKALGAVVGKTKTLGVKRGKVYCFDPYLMLGKTDLECFWKGVMYGIEVKSPTGRMSEHQRNYKEVFHKPPDRIFIEAYSLEDVQKIIS